jgi:glycosyltransferase involved in cell wall biosynthesis
LVDIESPKVSIVIPVRNGENYLAQALESVLAQDFRNFEVLVGINASSDRTADIARSVLGSNSPGIWEFPELVNMPANFNRIAAKARGEYLKFLCHDDILRFDAISSLLNQFQQHKNLAISSSYENFLLDAKPARGMNSFGRRRYVGSLRSQYRFTKFGNWIGGPSAVMIRRDDFLNSPFDESLPCAFDLDCWVRLSRKGKVAIFPEYLYSSRIHSDQGTNDCRDGGFERDLERITEKITSSHASGLRLVSRLMR